MGLARYKPFEGSEKTGLDMQQQFEFERSLLLGRVIVDFDPGPELRIGIYSDDEFEATFIVIEE